MKGKVVLALLLPAILANCLRVPIPGPADVEVQGEPVEMTVIEAKAGQLLVLIYEPLTTTVTLPAARLRGVAAFDPAVDELRLYRDGELELILNPD